MLVVEAVSTGTGIKREDENRFFGCQSLRGETRVVKMESLGQRSFVVVQHMVDSASLV